MERKQQQSLNEAIRNVVELTRRKETIFQKGDKVKWTGDEGESDQFGNNAKQKPPLTDQELWDNVGTIISPTDTRTQRMFGVVEYKIKGRKVHIKNVMLSNDVTKDSQNK